MGELQQALLAAAIVGGNNSGGGGGGGGESTIAWRPSVSADGTISWTRTSSTTPPTPVNVKGEKGDTGATGEKGDTGEKGADGAKGDKGDNGYSPTITVTEIPGGHRVTVTDAEGSESFDVMNGSGGGSIADIFDYDAPALLDMNGAHDIAKFMSGYLNLPGMATGIGTSRLGYKVPTVTAGTYTWVDGVDGQTATADVTITFADGSKLVKTLNFKTVKNRWVNAAKGVDGGYIDTGLTLDYGYTLFYEGCQPAGVSGTPIGAYASNAIRTTLRIMGNANKIQAMWPGNTEITSEATGINFNEMHSATVNASGVELTQGSTTYNGALSGTDSGTDSAPIIVFNEAAGAQYKNSVVRKAGVRSGADTLCEIVMAEIAGEIVGVDIANLTQAEQDEIISEAYSSVNASRIHRPVGTLEEVTA